MRYYSYRTVTARHAFPDHCNHQFRRAGTPIACVLSFLAIAGWHYWALVWGSVAQNAFIAAGAWLACRWIPSATKSRLGHRYGIQVAMNVYSHFAFCVLYSQHRQPPRGLAIWRSRPWILQEGLRLVRSAPNAIMAPMNAVVVSTLSRVNRDREQFQRYFLRAVSVLALVGMGIGADFALVGSDIIRFLLGPGLGGVWSNLRTIWSGNRSHVAVLHPWVDSSFNRPSERGGSAGRLIEFVCTASLFLLALRWGPVRNRFGLDRFVFSAYVSGASGTPESR